MYDAMISFMPASLKQIPLCLGTPLLSSHNLHDTSARADDYTRLHALPILVQAGELYQRYSVCTCTF